ncbi:scyllo-inosose 3-dehydrogenase [Blastococcus sp. SYSU D00820]
MRALVVDADWNPRPDAGLSEAELSGRWARDARLAWQHPRWSVTEHPDPVISAPDDVIIRSRAVGVAVSTLRMVRTDPDGYVVLPYRMRLPLVPGHEFAGEVVAVGPEVRSLRPGDAVAVETLRYCGRCAACRRGMVNQCLEGTFSGFSIDGGMAELAVAPERHARSLAPLRDLVEEQSAYEIGALCEPAGIAYAGMFLRAGGFLPGATVVVVGCGPIGLAAVALARCAGAARVLAFDPVARRCAAARALGADAVHDVTELAAAGTGIGEVVQDATAGAGADMVVEASGAGDAVAPQIEASLAIGAKVVLLGVGGDPVPTRTMAYMSRAAVVVGMMGHLGTFDALIDLHAAGRLDLRPIVSARFDLADGVAALQHAAAQADPKVLVLPNRRGVGAGD